MMMKIKILLLLFVALLSSGSAFSAPDGASSKAENFKDIVKRVRSIEIIGGSATGFLLAPGEFFKLSKECLKYGTVEDFKELLKDENAVVRVMGLVCLAQSAPARYAELAKAHSDDNVQVSYIIGCVIHRATVGQISQRLVNNPYFLGRDEGQLPTPTSSK
jgi:hypothetical protein